MTRTETLSPTRPLAGYILAAAGATMFSSKGILIKLGYAEGLDALTLLALRMIFAAPIFIAVGFLSQRGRKSSVRRRLDARTVAVTVATGLLGYWYASFSDFKGLETLSAQFERLILFTYPLFVVLIGAALFGQPLRWRAVAAFLISYAGLALVFVSDFRTEGPAVVVGAAWVLSSAVAFAVYQLLARPLILSMGAPMFTALAMTAAAAGVFVHFLLVHPLEALAVPPKTMAIAVAVAILATVLPTYLMNAALARISAAANATIGTLSPVVTLVLAAIVLGEVITASDLAGTALVLTGIGLFTWMDRRAAPDITKS
jgi:drug/metabolite transporter (DMT)-like permease